MPRIQRARSGIYRCPICCYRDMVQLPEGETFHEIDCGHCETPLELFTRGDRALILAVRLAQRTTPPGPPA